MTMTLRRMIALWTIVGTTLLFNFLSLQTSLPLVGSLYQFGFLLIVPGVMLALLLGLQRTGKLLFPLYSIGLSLFALLIVGLLVNTLVPLFQLEDRPLTLPYILVGYNFLIVSATAFWVAAWERPRPITWPRDIAIDRRHILLAAASVGITALSIAGATYLNNGGSDDITLAMLVAAGALVAYVGWTRKRLEGWIFPLMLACIGAALLFMYSLRSWHVIGSDVNQELQVFNATLSNGRWFAQGLIDSAYNACLSITVLPTQLALLTHLQPEYVYKLLIQILFALSPVMIYALARRFVSHKIAFFAGFVFAAQTWFIEQMPALIRQEVALLFFILACVVLVDHMLSVWQQRFLFGIFTAGVVVSHYSTAYVYIALLLLALLISYGARFIGKVPRLHAPRITLSKLLVAIALIIFWEGLITSSGAGAQQFAKNMREHAADAFTAESLKGTASQLTFSAPGVSNDDNLQSSYRDATHLYRFEKPGFNGYPTEITQDYQPELTDDQQYIHSPIPAIIAKPLLLMGRISKLLIVNVLSVVGLGLLLYRLRRAEPARREYTYLAAATIPLLLGILIFPIASASYNTTRLFLQVYILLVLPAMWCGYLLAKRWSGRWATAIVGGVLVLFFAYSSGLMGQTLGGPATITLNHPGGRYDSFYVHDSEVAAARWLSLNRQANTEVYADSMAILRLQSYAGMEKVNKDIFPNTVSRDGYVYMDYANTTRGIAYRGFDNGIVVYHYPTRFLDDQKNLLYSNGESKVYK